MDEDTPEAKQIGVSFKRSASESSDEGAETKRPRKDRSQERHDAIGTDGTAATLSSDSEGAPQQQNQQTCPGAAPGEATTGDHLAVLTGMNESQHAALGLSYPGSHFANTPQQGHLPNNAVRIPNPHGAVSPGMTATNTGQVMQNSSNLTNLLNPTGPEGLQIIAQTDRETKEWHQRLMQEDRNQLVYKSESNMSGVEELTLSDDPTILYTRTKTLSLPSESFQASRLQLHPPSPSEVSETSSDDYNERMARQRQETYNGRFEELLKTVSIDYRNQEIQDIQIAVLELLTRYKDKINEHEKYNLLRIEPCGSMAEKTAVWKNEFTPGSSTHFETIPSGQREILYCTEFNRWSGQVETHPYTEFDFLAVLERPSCLQIKKTSCQLCAKVTKTHCSRSLCCPGITPTGSENFNDMFKEELSSAIVSSCSCYRVDARTGPRCLFNATSTQHKSGCEKCTVYTQTGHLQIDSSIKKHMNCTLLSMWTSDAMMLVAPDELDRNKTRLSILIDFLPAFEIFKPKINENELQHDCFIVPKRCAHYLECGIGAWRISSCLAEIDHIVNTMSVKHRKCFKILKYCSAQTTDFLSGFHLKTAVLNHSLTCTESSEDCYTCVTAILKSLELAYTRHVLKSFSSKANLLRIGLNYDIKPLTDIKDYLSCIMRKRVL